MDKISPFTKSLISLELQLKTLFEEVGGEAATKLLDELSKLNRSEQAHVLKVFQGAIDKLRTSGIQLETSEDVARKKFEDDLYNDIVSSMSSAANGGDAGEARLSKKLRVVDGGKGKELKAEPVNLAQFRKGRGERRKTLH